MNSEELQARKIKALDELKGDIDIIQTRVMQLQPPTEEQARTLEKLEAAKAKFAGQVTETMAIAKAFSKLAAAVVKARAMKLHPSVHFMSISEASDGKPWSCALILEESGYVNPIWAATPLEAVELAITRFDAQIAETMGGKQ